MADRVTHRLLTVSAGLIVVSQLTLSFFVGRAGESGLDALVRTLIGWPVAFLLCAVALALGLFGRARATKLGADGARRAAGWLAVAALVVPAGNGLHRFWWPSPDRLVRAAGAGDLGVAKRCLLFGVDPSANGSAALVAAVNSGRPEITALLLEAGASPAGTLAEMLWQGPDRYGRRLAAFEQVLASGAPVDAAWLHLKAMFLENNGFGEALARAESDGVRTARPRVALLNAIALARSAPSRQAEAVLLYRQLRGDLVPRPGDERRAKAIVHFVHLSPMQARRDPIPLLHDEVLLTLAAKFGATPLVEAMLGDGVPVEPPDTRFALPRSPLSYAATQGDVATARVLVAAGADLARMDYGYGTPLHAAVASGSGELVDLLIANGADPDAPQSEISPAPPSHWTAYANDVAMLERLVAHGARLDAEGREGRTLRSIAERNRHRELLAYLDENGG